MRRRAPFARCARIASSSWLMFASDGRRPRARFFFETSVRLIRTFARRSTCQPDRVEQGDSNADSEILGPPAEHPGETGNTLPRADAGDVRRLQRLEGEVRGQHLGHGRQAQGRRQGRDRLRRDRRTLHGVQGDHRRVHGGRRRELRPRSRSRRRVPGYCRPGSSVEIREIAGP